MIKLRIQCSLLVFIGLWINAVLALYEDQAGKFDWKLSYIGKAKFAHIIDTKRVAVATEENVIAVLNSKTGQLLWRQILENPSEQHIQQIHVSKEVVTVSGDAYSWHVRGWELNSGILLWEWMLHLNNEPSSKTSSQVEWIVNNWHLIRIIPTFGSHFEVAQYDLRTGQQHGATTQIPATWLTKLSECVSAHAYYVCISSAESTGQLFYTNLNDISDQVYTRPLHLLIGNENGKVRIQRYLSDKPSFLLIKNDVPSLLVIEEQSVKVLLPYVSPNSVAINDGERFVLHEIIINPNNPEKLLRIISKDINNIMKQVVVDVQYPLGLGAPSIIAVECKNRACDLLLSSTDSALTLLKLPEGKVMWTREEALSHIVAVEFLELPVSELDASIEKEFKTDGDVFSMLYQRIISQTKQLTTVMFGNQLLTSSNGLVRDEFGLHKLIVVATSVGKLFAIDTFTGSIVWSYRLPYVVPYSTLNKPHMLLFVQRTARYAPLQAQCILIAKDAHTGNGVLFKFDPISGHSEGGIERLNYRIKQVLLLPYEDKMHIKGVLVLSEEDQIYIYPSSSIHNVAKYASTTYLYTIDEKSGLLRGYNLLYGTEDRLNLKLMWNMDVSNSKLIALSTRPVSERVHSQGRVLPDRSVYYKYINPNMIALATIADDAVHKHVVSVYLVDGVTGLVLYSACHKRAKGPVHLVHSENWVVYSYFNERFRRTEIATVELYEGRIQSNSTVFSSHAVSQLPQVEAQAYILPGTPLMMATTITERGITSKFIIFALSNGIVAEVPWAFIQPRLPDMTCGPEESCIPYMPEIPLHPEASVNYNQTLERVRGIHTAPARLESTSHVLVHGLDVFYTRVAPSKTFDLLKEDFDYKLIILVLMGLILASYITKKLASRKALKQAWK